MNMRTAGRKSARDAWTRRGQSLIEFTFVGIPMIFVLISIFEISRGMWIYHTLAYSVKVGVRYASVHGYNCGLSPNTCPVTMGPLSSNGADCAYETSAPSPAPSIATVIWCAGTGLDPTTTELRFTDASGTTTTCLLNACAATLWPPAGSNVAGNTISIQMVTPFKSAISMFWPGAQTVSFGVANLPASSTDTVKF